MLHVFQNEVEYFNLTVSTCPPGLALYSTNLENKFECRCDDDNDRNIIDCLPDERKLILKVHIIMKVSIPTCMFTMKYGTTRIDK